MKTHTHTPLPWHIGTAPGPIIYGPNGEQVASFRDPMTFDNENRANWQFTLRACNSHYELLEALGGLLAATAANHLPGIPELDDAQGEALLAIAKAKGVA